MNKLIPLCSPYELQECKNADFLRSSLSGGTTEDTQGNRVIDGKKWRSYCKGELHASSVMKRCKIYYFQDVEQKVIQYLELPPVRLYLRDKCGVSSALIHEKALVIVVNLGYAEGEFKASQGWISNLLHQHNKIGSNLHGEAGDMDESGRMETMLAWKSKTHQIIEDEQGISSECLGNADQTGLYYTKLYID
jgi:hypothetical protein